MGTERTLPRGRILAFVGITTVAALMALNALVGWLERSNRVDTHRPDDAVTFLQSDLFEADAGPYWRSTTYHDSSMLTVSFPVEQPGWRLFMSGGSFAMGTPYAHQGQVTEGFGGIASWLRHDYRGAVAPLPVEVINLGAGAQNSHRVREIVEQTLPMTPSAYLVATCNNEGAPAPDVLRRFLHDQPGYRALIGLTLGDAAPAERSTYTPQDPDNQRMRTQFEENLRAMVSASEASGVPLLLATLPVNLRFGHHGDAHLPDGRFPPVEIEPCAHDAEHAIGRGDIDAALVAAARCEDPAEELRWAGMAHAAAGRIDEATRALEQSVELRPRNRCRPSFNAIIREVAASSESTHLVDLDRAARKLSPDGLPGHELFVDSCHMNWLGYGLMAAEVRRVLHEAGLSPGVAGGSASPLERLEHARRVGLDPTPLDAAARRLVGASPEAGRQ